MASLNQERSGQKRAQMPLAEVRPLIGSSFKNDTIIASYRDNPTE